MTVKRREQHGRPRRRRNGRPLSRQRWHRLFRSLAPTCDGPPQFPRRRPSGDPARLTLRTQIPRSSDGLLPAGARRRANSRFLPRPLAATAPAGGPCNRTHLVAGLKAPFVTILDTDRVVPLGVSACEVGPRQRGKGLTRPRSALRTGCRGAHGLLVALPPVRVLFLSAKHLFLVARHAVARAKPAMGCAEREARRSDLELRSDAALRLQAESCAVGAPLG